MSLEQLDICFFCELKTYLMYGTLIGITAPISWSLIPLLTYYLKHLDPLLVMALVFFMFFAIEFIRQLLVRKLVNPMKIPARFYLYGIIGIFGFHIFYFSALRLAPIMPVYLIINSTSIFIIIYSKILHNIEIRPNHKLAFLINFLAICLIGFSKASEAFEMHHLIGYAMALLAANCMAFYTVKNRDFMDVPVRKVSYVILISGFLALLCYLGFNDSYITYISITDIQLLLLLAIWPIGYSFFSWVYGVKYGDIRVLSIIALINPVFGSIWLIVAGIEDFSWIVIISLGLILFGSLIARSK